MLCSYDAGLMYMLGFLLLLLSSLCTSSDSTTVHAVKQYRNYSSDSSQSHRLVSPFTARADHLNSLMFYTILIHDKRHSDDDFLGHRNSHYFLSFLKSIGGCTTADFLLLSNIDILPHERALLPSNVYYYKIKWVEILQRMSDILQYDLLSTFRLGAQGYYKINDYKAMIPLLYPHLFEQHEAFGWVDNDLWLSHKFVNTIRNAIRKVDTVLFARHCWGPLSAFRTNSFRKYIIPELVNRKDMLIQVLNDPKTRSFTEWGGFGRGVYEQSMSFIVSQVIDNNRYIFRTAKIILLYTAGKWMLWDGWCAEFETSCKNPNLNYTQIAPSDRCGYCFMNTENKSSLVDGYGEKVGFYHFECQKYYLKELETTGASSLAKRLTVHNYHEHQCFESSFRGGLQFTSC